MKVILVALGVLLSLQVFAQNTVTYTYDSAGNRVARSAPKAPVAQTSAKPTYELSPSVRPDRNTGLAQVAQKEKEPYRCLVVPDDPARESKNGSSRQRSGRNQVKRTN